MDIKGKVSIVTGGSRGIGRAIAIALAQKGAASVAIIYHTREKEAEFVSKYIKTLGVDSCVYKISDIGNFKEVANIVDNFAKKTERIDILVNNAAIAVKVEDFLDESEEIWDKTINVNLKGAFNFCKATIPYMLKQKSGKIINISSSAALSGGRIARSASYIASKAGLIGLTKVLAVQFTSKGISVNAIAPDHVDTDMLRENWGVYSREEANKLAKKIAPIGRLARPEEIAHAVIFLVENDYITGEVVNIAGGAYIRS